MRCGVSKVVEVLVALPEKITPFLSVGSESEPVLFTPQRKHGQPFIAAGCWLQVTAGAITGGFGERAQALAQQLLSEDAVTVVASDGHNSKARPPVLKEAYDKIANDYGEDRARRLMLHTPARIVASQFQFQFTAEALAV